MLNESHREILTARRAEIAASLADAEGRLAAAVDDMTAALMVEKQIVDEREKFYGLLKTVEHPILGLSSALGHFTPTIPAPCPSSAGLKMSVNSIQFTIDDLRLGLRQIDLLLAPPAKPEPEPEESNVAAARQDDADFGDVIVFPSRKDAAE